MHACMYVCPCFLYLDLFVLSFLIFLFCFGAFIILFVTKIKVTAGHNAGGPRIAYPRLFIDWLNAKYPCKESDSGKKGVHKHISSGATSAQEAVNWRGYEEGGSSSTIIDLAIIEYNVNGLGWYAVGLYKSITPKRCR